MKKSAKKTPATKATKAPAKKAPAAKPAAAARKKAVAVAAPVIPAGKSASPSKQKRAGETEAPATFISAQIDVGFGNHLYIRGEGPGLSWDHGVALDCVGDSLWTISIKNAATPVVFKLLLNDETWSTGNDFEALPGQILTLTPTF